MFVEDPPVTVAIASEAEPLTVSEDGSLIVADQEAGERLDRFLAIRLPEHSRTRLKSLILEGHVKIFQGINSYLRVFCLQEVSDLSIDAKLGKLGSEVQFWKA